MKAMYFRVLTYLLLVFPTISSAQVNSWRSLWEFRDQDMFFDICAHPDGGAFLVGTSAWTDIYESSEVWALALDTDGGVNQAWGQPDFLYRFSDFDVNIGYGATETSTGRCMIVGTTGYNGGEDLENMHGFFLLLNRWKCPEDALVTNFRTAFYDVAECSDGGFVAVGATEVYNSPIHATDIVVRKVGPSLDRAEGWSTNCHSSNPNTNSREFGTDVLELPDGRIVVAGSNLAEGGRLLLLDGSTGTVLNSYWNPEIESYSDVEFLYSSTSMMENGSDGVGDAHIVALGTYGGDNSSSSMDDFTGAGNAVVIEYVIPANYDWFSAVGDPHVIHNNLNFKTIRLNRIHSLGASYVMTGTAQLLNGNSAVIVGAVDKNFNRDVSWRTLQAQGYYADINSYATWMRSGSHIIRRGLFFDCMITQSRHMYGGFGGENHVWFGEALFEPEVAIAGFGPIDEPQISQSAVIENDFLALEGSPRTGYRLILAGVSGQVDIEVFDMTGRKVASTSVSTQERATNSIDFGSSSGFGSELSSGVYFVRIESSMGNTIRSMVLAK